MPTRKIADLPTDKRCRHPEHDPPTAMCFPPGIYEHECPACGRKVKFRADRGTLSHRHVSGWKKSPKPALQAKRVFYDLPARTDPPAAGVVRPFLLIPERTVR